MDMIKEIVSLQVDTHSLSTFSVSRVGALLQVSILALCGTSRHNIVLHPPHLQQLLFIFHDDELLAVQSIPLFYSVHCVKSVKMESHCGLELR